MAEDFGVRLSDGTLRYTNCTKGGPVFVYVKDGRITRVEPINLGPDDAESWTIEARGRIFTPPRRALLASYTFTERARIYAPNRNLYPLKRVDFNPQGQRRPENRGKSKYERISWEEALDILTSEIERIVKNYGAPAIITTASSHHSWGNIGYRLSAYHRFMSILGATYADHNPDSWEGWFWGAMHHWGFSWRLGIPEQYDLLEDALRHCEMIVFWSSDPHAINGIYAGNESVPWRFWLKDLNVKMVFIDPFYNWTAINFADKWLAPRPGTDTALALGIAYTWITEGTYDKEYIQKRTLGFEKWRDYVLGEEDNQPKSPEWAEKICDVPAREIRALAREWAKKRTMIACGRGGHGGACRAAYGHEWSRMLVLLAAMQGLGKPGINIWGTNSGAPFNAQFYFPGYSEGGISGDTTNTAASTLLMRGITKRPVRWTINEPQGQHVLRLLLPEAILSPPVEWRGKGFAGIYPEAQFRKYKYPEDGFAPAKMFWRYGTSYISSMTETNRWVKMYRSEKLEFVVNQSIWFEGEAKFADLILPACTNFERWDIGEWCSAGGYSVHASNATSHRIIALEMKCIEPRGESKSDYDIFALVSRRLGFYEKYTDDGLTDLDWVKRMFEASDLPKYISWKDFMKKGYFVVPLQKPYKSTPALRWFAEGRKRDTPDPGFSGGKIAGLPDGYGLGTSSGLLEFESQTLKRFDPNDPERPTVPKYIPSWEGHESAIANKYPLQLISPHPRFTFFTQYDGKDSWLNDIPDHRRQAEDGYHYWILRINPADAEKRGIKDGDLVKAYNDRGSVIFIAEVTERMRPGVVHSYMGSAEYEPIDSVGESPDRGGCVNLLTPSRLISKNASGMAPNSCLIEVAKWR
ncbi:MAG: molybdopterin-dependent oxidoreductase [Candidatus Bathyarchaeia archaeon]